MSNSQQYKGFSISYDTIRDGNEQYTGLVAKRSGIRIESPQNNRNNYSAVCKSIDELKSNK